MGFYEIDDMVLVYSLGVLGALVVVFGIWCHLEALVVRFRLLSQGIRPVSTIPMPFLGDAQVMMAHRTSPGVFNICDGDRCTSTAPALQLIASYCENLGIVHQTMFGLQSRIQLESHLHLKDLLISKAACFEKTNLMRSFFSRILEKESILIASHEDHRRFRKALNPAFHHDILKNMTQGIGKIGKRFVSRVLAGDYDLREGKQREGWRRIDLVEFFTELTLEIICGASFGALDGGILEEEEEKMNMANEIGRHLGRAIDHVQKDVVSLLFFLPFYDKFPTRRNAEFMERKNRAKKMASLLVSSHNQNNSTTKKLPGFLQSILQASDTVGGSENWVVSQLLTFLAAGHETTSIALTWTVFLLVQHPEWLERVRKEIATIISKTSTAFPTYQQIEKQLPILDAIFNESQRVFPSIPMIGRLATTDVVIGDPSLPLQEGGLLTIPKGCVVNVFPPLIHRDPKRFPHPNVFDPSRFLPDDIITSLSLRRISSTEEPSPATALPYLGHHVNSFDFLPFVIGDRSCIGARLARLEARTILAIILPNLDFSITDSGYSHFPDMAVSLRPRDGMPLFVKQTPQN